MSGSCSIIEVMHRLLFTNLTANACRSVEISGKIASEIGPSVGVAGVTSQPSGLVRLQVVRGGSCKKLVTGMLEKLRKDVEDGQKEGPPNFQPSQYPYELKVDVDLQENASLEAFRLPHLG